MKAFRPLLFLGLAAFSSVALAEISLDLSPASLDMGEVTTGQTTSGNAVIGIVFNGSGDLNGSANNGSVTSIAILNDSGGHFSESQACVGTAFSANDPGQTCDVVVQCTPTSAGVTVSADLEVQFARNNGTAADVETVAVSCRGVDSGPLPPVDPTAVPALGGLGVGLLAVLMGGLGAFAGFRRRR